MRILLITFRDSLEQEVYHLLREEVKAYTVIPLCAWHGGSRTGFRHPGVAWEELHDPPGFAKRQSRAVGETFTDVRDHLAELQHGAKIPMRAVRLAL